MNVHPQKSSFDAGLPLEGQRSELSRFASILTALGVGLFLIALYRNRVFFHDDTYISLRYARNLVEHGVLEWNLGERVEGYTNFLHLILCAGLMKLGVDPVASTRIVNGASVAALVFLTWRMLLDVLPSAKDAAARSLGLLLMLAAPALPVWMLGGLEAVMAAALLTAGVAWLLPAAGMATGRQPRPILGGLLLGAAILTRPDTAVAAGAFLLALVLFDDKPWARSALVDRLRIPFIAGVATALPVLLHVAWRYSYYGDLLPNTFYAKVGVSTDLRLANGVHYLLASYIYMPAIWMAAAFAACAMIMKCFPRAAAIIGFPIVAHIAYIIWAGGDHMAAGRMFVPVIGLLSLVLAILLGAFQSRQPVRDFGVIAALAAGVSLIVPAQSIDRAAFMGRAIGEYLDRTMPPGTLVALATAGSTPFYAPRLQFIDTLGLVDRTIAKRREVPMLSLSQMLPGHAKGDGAYVLSRQPDIWILGGAIGAEASNPVLFLSDMEGVRLPGFSECYQRVQVQVPYEQPVVPLPMPTPDVMNFIYFKRTCAK